MFVRKKRDRLYERKIHAFVIVFVADPLRMFGITETETTLSGMATG